MTIYLKMHVNKTDYKNILVTWNFERDGMIILEWIIEKSGGRIAI
jgi:hypothetical protein